MSLSSSLLSYPIPAATQELIVRSLFEPADYTPVNKLLNPYFQYYTEQCRIATHVHGSQLQAKTHDDILDIVGWFYRRLDREAIRQHLLVKFSSDKSWDGRMIFDSSIDLAVRLALMIDIGELRNAFSGRRRLIWIEGPLQAFVKDVFPDSIALGHDGIKLGTSFTARNMNRVAGLRIELTTNLVDHLRLRHDDRTVSIFHHASFLRYQEK